jgi:diacylglycerol kinase (ATP)
VRRLSAPARRRYALLAWARAKGVLRDAGVNRLAVLSNAQSRGNRGRALERLGFSGLDGLAHAVTHAADELPDALDALLATRPAALAINGGDGTSQRLLTLCRRRGDLSRLPPLAFLPGGTTNMNARELGGGGSRRAALEAFLALRALPRPQWPLQRQRVLLIDIAGGASYAGLVFALGAVVFGVEYWERSHRQGSLPVELGLSVAVARTALSIARRTPPFDAATPVELGFGSAPPQRAAVSCLLVSALDRLFFGFRPFWGGGDGPLACTWLDERPRAFARRLPALLWGRGAALRSDDGYHSLRTERVAVELDDPWLLDGEIERECGRLLLTASAPLPFLDLSRAASAARSREVGG